MMRGIFPGRGEMSKFLLGEEDSYICIVQKELCQQVFIHNEEAPCTSHTSCVQVAILLLQDFSTLRVSDIYGIYFHLSVQCS